MKTKTKKNENRRTRKQNTLARLALLRKSRVCRVTQVRVPPSSDRLNVSCLFRPTLHILGSEVVTLYGMYLCALILCTYNSTSLCLELQPKMLRYITSPVYSHIVASTCERTDRKIRPPRGNTGDTLYPHSPHRRPHRAQRSNRRKDIHTPWQPGRRGENTP